MVNSIIRKIKSSVIELSEKGDRGERLYTEIKYSVATIIGKILGEDDYAKWFYNLYTRRKLNLDNPTSFDEKLWWLKLNNKDPLLTVCSDKHRVREYVKNCGYENILIPQLEIVKKADEIDFSKYDFEVVAKCNHNSGGHVFYNPKKQLTEKELKEKIRKLNFILGKNASVLSREWNYKNIEPCIVVEKVIRDKQGNLPLDYKFMCFDGEPKLLFLDLGVINPDSSYNHDYPRNIYDMNFNLMPIHETRPNADYEVKKPENFEYMIEIARKLSQPFPHCRVDLYNVDGKVYFGEITFYHGGGCNDIQPEEWDLKMGSWIDLNSPKIVRKKN